MPISTVVNGDPQLDPIDEAHADHDVDLPQLHGALPLPALVVLQPAPAGLGSDEAMPHQAAVDGRAGWRQLELARSLLRIVRGPHPGLVRLSATMRASTSGGIWWGQRSGFELRSARAPSPPAAYRVSQR